MIVAQLLGTLCGLVILIRAVSIINKMALGTRREHYGKWLGFGLGYALLAAAALGSMLAIWETPVVIDHFPWLFASASLILFDRRRRRPDPEATLPPPPSFWRFWAR